MGTICCQYLIDGFAATIVPDSFPLEAPECSPVQDGDRARPNHFITTLF